MFKSYKWVGWVWWKSLLRAPHRTAYKGERPFTHGVKKHSFKPWGETSEQNVQSCFVSSFNWLHNQSEFLSALAPFWKKWAAAAAAFDTIYHWFSLRWIYAFLPGRPAPPHLSTTTPPHFISSIERVSRKTCCFKLTSLQCGWHTFSSFIFHSQYVCRRSMNGVKVQSMQKEKVLQYPASVIIIIIDNDISLLLSLLLAL